MSVPVVSTDYATVYGYGELGDYPGVQINGTTISKGGAPFGLYVQGFEWGLTTSYGSHNENVMEGTPPFAIFESIIHDRPECVPNGNLVWGTTYHFRCYGYRTDTLERGNGADMTFTTPSVPVSIAPLGSQTIVSLEAIRNIEMSAMGSTYVDEEGYFVYNGRHARNPEAE